MAPSHSTGEALSRAKKLPGILLRIQEEYLICIGGRRPIDADLSRTG